MSSRPRLLLVDDDRAMCELLATRLGKRGFDVTWFTAATAALDALRAGDFDVVVSDVNMPDMRGLDLARAAIEARPNVPVLLITAFGSMDTAIAAIRAGAYDFLPKPFEIEQLVLAVERALVHARLRDEVRRLREEVAGPASYGELLGESASIQSLYALLDKVAPSDAPVLITGESGTGKELVAKALHARGAHRAGPFVAINCAALPENLLESELFGHVKGAFTDARAARSGLFVAAKGGTLFLDEIGELPMALQPKLLRALQERKVRPVGGNEEIAFDARVVTATNRDLEVMVEARTFREDLYFRIAVLQVALPPLRARAGDVLLLAQHFLGRIATRTGKHVTSLSAGAAARLMAYPWPGNVRELENCMERAVALASFDHVAPEDLPEKVRGYEPSRISVGDDPSDLMTLDALERQYVVRVLEVVSGNKSAAARILGIERKTLYRMLERWGLGSE